MRFEAFRERMFGLEKQISRGILGENFLVQSNIFLEAFREGNFQIEKNEAFREGNLHFVK